MRYCRLMVCVYGCFLAMMAQAKMNQEAHWLSGVSVGYTYLKGSITDPDDVFYKEPYSSATFAPYFFMGYQQAYDQWLWGTELNIDWQKVADDRDFTFKMESTVSSANVSYEHGVTLGLSERLGYSLTPYFMPYLRFGIEAGKDRLDTHVASEATKDKMWVYRFLFGLGVELPLPVKSPLSLRFEYDYHSKGKTLITNAAQVQPWAQSARIALVWSELSW